MFSETQQIAHGRLLHDHTLRRRSRGRATTDRIEGRVDPSLSFPFSLTSRRPSSRVVAVIVCTGGSASSSVAVPCDLAMRPSPYLPPKSIDDRVTRTDAAMESCRCRCRRPGTWHFLSPAPTADSLPASLCGPGHPCAREARPPITRRNYLYSQPASYMGLTGRDMRSNKRP